MLASFSIDHVETLTLDFAKLKTIGFRPLKVRTGTLLRGISGARLLCRRGFQEAF
jgi:hypothetical protein